mgnify:FL=1
MTWKEKIQLKVLRQLDLSKEVADEELVEIIRSALEEDEGENYIPLSEKAGIGKELFNTFRKLDILQELLEEEDITEIMINGTNNIFVEEEGKLIQ